MLNLNTRSRLPNAGMDAHPSPQMSKPFAFLTYPFLWVLATFRPANKRDACTVRVEMMFFIITFWKTCSRCKKKGWSWIAVVTQKLCQLDLKTLWNPHLYMCLCWNLLPFSAWFCGVLEKKWFGDLSSDMSVPMKALPIYLCWCLSPKNEQKCLHMVLDAAEVNFRQIKRKYFMVQITQDSFTYSTLHINMVVL